MKNVLVGMMLASVFIVPAARAAGHGGGSGGGSAAPAASSSSTANGGAGGTGGSAAGGSAAGGSATGGQANGNTSSVSVSLTTDYSGSSGTSSGSAGTAADPSSAGAANVQYAGSYTVKSAPAIVAPSLTSTFSDTCMGSASFGLSFVGFGATAGSTMVDEACVRRLDSREFRAMGLNDVALALLCQSAANRKAVEATGRACPSAPGSDTASIAPTPVIKMSKAAERSTAMPPIIDQQAAPITLTQTPQASAMQTSQPISLANTEAKPMEVLSADPVEVKPLPDELSSESK
ncbi:MAG: hypothetical protein JWQ10_3328 [Herbaspirillum sp.]|jgi:hypothetical protein|nr:hypothetical protein [Herbaspirillum sp.]